MGGSGELRDLIERQAIDEGADLFGVADASGFLDREYQGKRPQEFMPGIRSVAVIAVVIPNGAIEPLPKGRPEYTNTLLAATVTLRAIGFKLARTIEKAGFQASIVPNEGSEFGYWYADKETLFADLSVKYAAYLAGLGSYGVNSLLLTPQHGPRVRLCAVLTDAPLEATGPMLPFEDARCQGCLRCVAVCPVAAISKDGMIDRHKCADYMFARLGGLRCGLCLKACPL